MEPRFTRGEYWLLETAVELAQGFRFLDDGGQEFSQQYNKVSHRMQRSELIETLKRLKTAGLISFGHFDDPGENWTEKPDVQIDEALDEDHEVPWTCYRLTKEGGRQWELFASPRWNYYLHQDDCWDTVEGTDETPQIGIYTSVEPKWLKTMVNLMSNGFRPIDLESVEYSELGPWDATYWKVLPSGYRAKVRYVGDNHQFISHHVRPDASTEELRQEIARHEFCRLNRFWHKPG